MPPDSDIKLISTLQEALTDPTPSGVEEQQRRRTVLARGIQTAAVGGPSFTLTATAKDPVTGAVTRSAPQRITVADAPSVTATTTASPSSHEALFSQLRDLVADSGVATFAPRMINMTDPSPTTTASLANKSFALLNQYLAGNTGRFDPGQIVAAASNGPTWGQDSFLTRPQH